MFGSLGIWEIVFIVILGLLVFGPRKLPEISRTIGRTLGELRRSAEDFQRTVEREAMDLERSVKPVARGDTEPGDLETSGNNSDSNSSGAGEQA